MADIPIGLAVKKAREHMRMSKGDLARLSGVNRQHIYKVENGISVPGLTTLDSLATGIGIETWRILKYAQAMRDRAEAA